MGIDRPSMEFLVLSLFSCLLSTYRFPFFAYLLLANDRHSIWLILKINSILPKHFIDPSISLTEFLSAGFLLDRSIEHTRWPFLFLSGSWYGAFGLIGTSCFVFFSQYSRIIGGVIAFFNISQIFCRRILNRRIIIELVAENIRILIGGSLYLGS